MHETIELDKQGLRKFGLVTGAILVGLFAIGFPWLLERPWPTWPWIVAAALWIPALLFPAALKPVYHGWMKFGAVLGFVNTRIILGVFFFLILAPIGFVMRLFGHDPMGRVFGAPGSYRVPSRNRTPDNMEKPY